MPTRHIGISDRDLQVAVYREFYAYSRDDQQTARLSYSTNRGYMYRRAAAYVDIILKGAKPADLPVERPTKFDFVINLKTAKALGIKVPPSILFLVTEVVE